MIMIYLDGNAVSSIEVSGGWTLTVEGYAELCAMMMIDVLRPLLYTW